MNTSTLVYVFLHTKSNPGPNGCIMYVHCAQEPTTVNINTITSSQFLQLQPKEVEKITFGEELFPVFSAESKAIWLTSSAEIQVLMYKNPDDPSNSYPYNGVYQVPSNEASRTLFLTGASNKPA